MEKNMKEKQKLDRRNIFTPTDPPQVRGNCNSSHNGIMKSLNREETLSEPSLKTPSNNPDVDAQGNAVWTVGRKNLLVVSADIFPKKKRGEKKMDISTKKVKLVKYGKGVRFTAQFYPTLSHGVSLGEVI